MLTIEEFKAYKQQLAAIIASFSQKIANLSSEEKLAFQKDFEEMFRECEDVTTRFSIKRSLPVRAAQCLLRLIAPLL